MNSANIAYNLMAEGGTWQTWLIMGVLVVAIIGLFVWQSISSKKKQKESQNMMDQMKIGDRVKTIGGVCGFLYEINKEENTIVLETGTGDKKCYVKFDRSAIYQTGPANPEKVEEKPAEKEEKKDDKEVKAEPIEEVKVEEKPAVEEKAEEKAEEKTEEVKEEKPAKKTSKKAK